MRWWTLPALLVCLGGGYLLGAMRAEPNGRRAPRVGDAPGVQDRVPTPPPSTAPIGETAPAREAALLDVAVVAPDPASTTEDADPEQGILVVDFTGFDGPAYARLESTDIEGNLDYMEQGADEDHLASFDLYPGDVLVRWQDHGAMRRFAARARVEAGRVTRVLAADPRHVPLPDPPGLAVLDVRVVAAGGGPIADVGIWLAGKVLGDPNSVDVSTDPEGCARFRVRAGSYQVLVGGRTETVSIRTSDRRLLELRHDSHGEIVIDPTLEGDYALHPRAEGEASPLVFADGQEAVCFPFVPPGSYDLWYTFRSNEGVAGTAAAWPESRVVATFDVRAGRAERLAHHPEPGFLEVRVQTPASTAGRRWQMRIYPRNDEAAALLLGLEADAGALRGRAGPLAKGAYTVEVLADGEVQARQDAVVAYGPTRLEANLERR